MNISKIMVFEKTANLMQYYRRMLDAGKISDMGDNPPHYAKERKVTLVLALGTNKDGKNVAKIKCPINPFPVRGEFEFISVHDIVNSLDSMGWKR